MTTTAPAPRAPERAERAAGGDTLAGTGALLRFALRRDRIRLPVWILALWLGTLLTAQSYQDLYATAAERQSVAETMDSPAGLAMSGPSRYLADYTYGSMLSHQMLGFVTILVAIMSVLIVCRHTRTEEETGRAELVRSTVVGRHAYLTAALTVALLANLALALLLTVGLAGLGIEGITWGGSLLYGAAHAAVGLVFAAVAAVTVQLTAHSRGASGMALAVLGVAYVLRVSGDVGSDAMAWLSPIGWAQRTYAYVDDRWWPLLPALVLTAVAATAAYALSTRRDVGAGLRAARLGRATASEWLVHPFGFALRLHRGLLTGFGAGLFFMGVSYGSILGEAEKMLENVTALEEALDEIGGGSVAESFASMAMVVVAIVASIYVVMAALRPRAEESTGRAEPLLATALSRARWAGSHLAVAMTGGTVLLLLAGLGFGLTGAASVGDSSLLPRLLGAAVAYAPALWVTAGVTVVLFGWLPRASAAAWLVVVYAFVVGYLGQILRFPDWMNNLSPFGHVPRLPAASLDWTPLVILTALAAALVAVGLAGLRRRDLESK
ncbi:ABC transporter permease [Streptomyces gobiensis]|uniref:ABC transporter permease n=1 Tax=Streptomyces gobiensis TaxID=2875706 RepID=UPI001E46C962|nr:ABC transporter permease [Streptomyces gobiensis]UGY92728.1 ABC transporter permease [Streptomyces gobiensis]